MTILDYHRSVPGEEEASDAWDRLGYVESRLDKATGPEAVSIREYLALTTLHRGGGRTPDEVVLETDDIGLAVRTGTGHRLLMRAAHACTDLGHPELEEFLHDQEPASQ